MPSSIKKSYHDFLINYRRALTTSFYEAHKMQPDDFREVAIMHTIAFVLYTGVHIQSFQNDFTRRVAKKGGVSFTHAESLNISSDRQRAEGLSKVHRIKEKLSQLLHIYYGLKKGKSYLGVGSRERAFVSYLGAVTWASLDLSLYGSLVSVKFRGQRQDRKHPLNFIRMSTPTIGSNENTQINPEFKAYLSYLKLHGLKHTYISYQDNVIPKLRKIRNFTRLIKFMGITNESYRARALERLSEGEFFDTLLVVTLSKDSRFYFQSRKRDKRPTPVGDFLGEFFKYLFESHTYGYYVPASWRESGSRPRRELESMLAQLVDILFDDGSLLTRIEKQNYLEIAYSLIVDYGSRDAFSLNQTCKDGIDRAGAANALSYTILLSLAVFAEVMDEDDFEQHLESLFAMIFSDALLSKKREIMKIRLHRFQQAALFLLDRIIERPDVIPRLLKLLHVKAPLLEWDAKLQVRDPLLTN